MRQRSRRQGRAYAAIPNAAMRDERISIEARGLLALLMTYADDWTFVVDHLQKVAGCGRDKMRGMLKELEAAGYVVREVLRGAGGHLAGTEWMIVDDPAEPARGVGHGVMPQDDVDQGRAGEVRRPPENPSVGATDPLKNRPPVEPTAGKSGPIRKPTDKKTNLKNSPNPSTGSGAGGDDPDGSGFPGSDQGQPDPDLNEAFAEFWAVYPRPEDQVAARRAWRKAATAETVEAIIAAARAYHDDDRVKRGFAKLPANWLMDRCWQDAKATPSARVVDLDALAALWVPKLTAGKPVPPSAISPRLARHMLDKGLVTPADLRRAGVQA